MKIHPSALIDSHAELDSSVEVGPYCVVGPHVRLGARTRLISHVVIDGRTQLGSDNVVYPFASLGMAPQDLKFQGEPARLIIGDHNTIREGATLNIGTEHGLMETRIGNHCLLMAYAHVAHDCTVGDRCVLANGVGLGGHVEVAANVFLGGMSGVHQYCRIGRHAFAAGGAMVAQDVPPFCIVQGDRAQLVGINELGLRRAGLSPEPIALLRNAYRDLFLSDTTRLVALERTEQALVPKSPDVAELCQFIRGSKRGVCRPRAGLPATDPYEG